MSEYSYSVALVEDEDILRQEMAFQLGHMGFTVETFNSAAGLYRYMATHPRSIVVLDIGLPGEDGLAICQYLRSHDPQLGIVFLTARGLRDDRLQGLASGADAYLVKPVDMEELVFVLRRLSARFTNLKSDTTRKIQPAGDWVLDTNSGFLIAPNQTRIRLSVNEGQICKTLMARRAEVCLHSELSLAIGLTPQDTDRHRIEVIVSRLRSKIERECGQPFPIKSVRNVGYLLEEGD